ncbi:HD domain-containing protein [candidate division WOR-3 bacterium]|uniref:HD domain-containing protein n=1 Tax=candidate division WOR-3 bacterium TaxID=2052148 RepID=A0A9D5KB62_UNCW3|nr:HD domain-containing protein [candidate division WOR-3 bacterium]MBD3365495.1 HD domain-containing protein [candidate division WOR-3 bacterium]
MTREEALKLVVERVSNVNLRKHMWSTEACLRAIAPRFEGDPDLWGIAGLMHDVSYEDAEKAGGDLMLHAEMGAGLAEEKGLDREGVQAIRAHAGGVPLESDLDKVLYAVDPLTGLIVAAALMHPEKLAGLQTRSVLKRFKDKRFAAGADRDQIRTCSDFGMELEEFVSVCLEAMRGIRDELGL